jgi:hypothetical protein
LVTSILRIRERCYNPKGKIIFNLIKIRKEDQGLGRRDSSKEKTFTKKIKYNLNKILKTLANEQR